MKRTMEFKYCLPSMSIEECKEVLKSDAGLIAYLPNATEELQLIAVQRDGTLIKHITFPTLKVQKLAIDKNWTNVRYIYSLHPDLQLYIVKAVPVSFSSIKNPTIECKNLAYSQQKSAKFINMYDAILDIDILHRYSSELLKVFFNSEVYMKYFNKEFISKLDIRVSKIYMESIL